MQRYFLSPLSHSHKKQEEEDKSRLAKLQAKQYSNDLYTPQMFKLYSSHCLFHKYFHIFIEFFHVSNMS